MLTVTLKDIHDRIRVLEARRGYAHAASLAARSEFQVMLFTGETIGLDVGIGILRDLERFFDSEPGA